MDNTATATSDTAAEDQFKQRLLELGLLTTITPPLPPQAFPKDRQLVSLDGRPGSQILLEERR